VLEVIMRLLGVLVFAWLIVGALAAGQRGYYSDIVQGNEPSCTNIGTIALTVVAGGLNYVGVHPRVNCELPQQNP
jgi:hypothetical protein